MISTVVDWFFREHLQHSTPLQPLNDILDINVAGGYKLPYHGYIATSISIPLKCEPGYAHYETLVLVVPGTVYGQNVPVLIGTNIIKLVQDTVDTHLIDKMPEPWRVALQCFNPKGTETSNVNCNNI